MRRLERFAQLSVPRQGLVRLCQIIGYGQIIDLHVGVDGEPSFIPEPLVVLEVKLDGDRQRAETDLADFALRDEVVRLMDRIDAIGTGRIEKIEIRAGLPKRVLIRASLREVIK